MLSRCLVALCSAVLAAPCRAQDPLTKQALGRIEEVEKQEPGLAAGDRAGAARLINSLDWAGKRLGAVRDQSEATWKSASKRYQDLRAKLEAKANATAGAGTGDAAKPMAFDAAKLAQLDKDIVAATHNFEIVPRKLLTDPNRSKAVAKELEQLEKRLVEFPGDAAPVMAAAGRLRSLQQSFRAAMEQVARDGAASGDVARRLAELEKKYERDAMPTEPAAPFQEAQLRAFAANMKRWRGELETDGAFLATAASNTAADGQQVERLRRWLGDSWRGRLDELDKAVGARITHDVERGQSAADFVLATDPAQRDQIVNRILGKGRFDENLAQLRDGEHALAMERVYAEAMARPAADRGKEAEKVKQAIAHLQKLAVTALEAVRMPAAASKDPELAKIAAETLARPEYGVKGWVRLVVNADKVRRESREATVGGSGAAKTITVHHYVWDEFQVATAEKVGDEVWVFFNRLKHFQSGDPTTPIGRWVLSQRFESTRILAENVER